MENLCHTLLTMTLTSTAAALVVMALRLVLRGTPRSYIYILWIVVILRMLCPFELLSGPVSLIPEPVTSGRAAEVILDRNRTAPAQTVEETEPAVQSAEPPVQAPATVQETPPPTVTPYQVMGGVWIAGLAGMLLWTAVSYGRVRRRVAEAVMAEPKVYESDRIDTPFVLGRSIYLPAGLKDPDRRYVLLHEQVHVKQWDPLWKSLAWLALSVHWFNPVLWLAYRLLCRDIETVCDQHVLEGFAPETRREDTAGYAAALLHLGRRERLPQTVLPFGEENAKGRIKDVLKYKRPAKWVTVVTSVLFAAVMLGLLWNPQAKAETVELQGREVYAAAAEWADAETDEMYSVTLTDDLLRELAEILEDAPSRTYQSQEAVEKDPALVGWNGRYEPLAGESPQLTFWCEHDVVCILSGYGNGTVLWADGAGDAYVLYPDVKDSKKFRDWELKFAALIEQTKTPMTSPAEDSSDKVTDPSLLLDGHPVDSVTIGVPRYGRGNQMVDFPEELTRELVSVLQAHPHEDFRPVTEEDRQTDHGDLVPMAGNGDMVILSGDGVSQSLYVFRDGVGFLHDGRAQQIALIPGLGTADDFLAWQDHARKWLTEDWPREVYARCTDPEMNSWSREERLVTVLSHLGLDIVLNWDKPVDSWNNGVLRLNLDQLTLGDDGEAAADLVQNDLGGVCWLLRTVLTDVNRVVFVTKEGVELTVDVSNGAPLGEEGFAELFISRAGAPLGHVSSGTVDRQTSVEVTASTRPTPAPVRSAKARTDAVATKPTSPARTDIAATEPTSPAEPSQAVQQEKPAESPPAAALPEGFTFTPEREPPPTRDMPDSMNFDFTQTDETTNHEGVE